MKRMSPTIKGIFVKSHIKALERDKGMAGVRTLERKYGRSLRFTNNQDVPIRDEVRIIELCIDILHGKKFPRSRRSFEAGRLHFRNFSATPLARIILSTFGKQFKQVMMGAEYIAGHVFQGVRFNSKDVGKNKVQIIMENNDYPIEHFQGLFYEWLRYSGLTGNVKATKLKDERYSYVMEWKNPGR